MCYPYQGFPQNRPAVSKSAVENVSQLSKSLPTHFPSSTVLSLLVSVLHSATRGGAIDACAYAIAQIDNAPFFRKLRRIDFDVSHSKQPYSIAEYTDSNSDESKQEPQKPLQARVATKPSSVFDQ